MTREEIIKSLNRAAEDEWLLKRADYYALVCKLAADALEHSEPVVNAVWVYYTNDEGRARWRCGNCGKLCRRNPHDKKRCSRRGAHMRMEG